MLNEVKNNAQTTRRASSLRRRLGHTNCHFMYKAICVKTTLAPPTEKLMSHETETNFAGIYYNLVFFSWRNLNNVLYLIYLKIEVSVSEPLITMSSAHAICFVFDTLKLITHLYSV